MRHYEIVFLVVPNRGEQVSSMIEKYTQLVEEDGGKVHRLEEWGRRELAYPIQNYNQAYYVLMNIESSLEALRQIEKAFRFSDHILRNLVIKKDAAETEPSFVLLEKKEATESEKPVATPAKETPVNESATPKKPKE
jgi:small subunit ribosomal protein S6